MPILENSTYRRPTMLCNRHLETIVPGLFRKVEGVVYTRERIDTPDRDFLDLDWIKGGNKKLVIISHGLEGDSARPYIKGMARTFALEGWDVLAWNYRGCSGELNKQARFYHSGATDDLETVVCHVSQSKAYNEISLVGYSLGGNMTLKYLGEGTTEKFPELNAAVVFSVPLDLAGCSRQIDKPYNILYSQRFLRSLKKKANLKRKILEEYLDLDGIEGVTSIYDFDDRFTAPLHGFKDADDYYSKSSSRNFLANIPVPTLVVNALNDPFLSESCLDATLFDGLKHVYFERPAHGGHCGFSQSKSNGRFWSDERALEFIKMFTDKNG